MMLSAFLTAKGFLGLKNQWWLLIALAILTASATMIAIAKDRNEHRTKVEQEAGAAKAVVEGQREIIQQVERANDAEVEIDRSGNTGRYDRCLRDATPATVSNCQRFVSD